MRQKGINACYFAKMHNIIPPFDNSKVDIFFIYFITILLKFTHCRYFYDTAARAGNLIGFSEPALR